MIRTFAPAALAVAMTLAAPAPAQQPPTRLGSFGDWQAFTFEEGGQTGCFVYSTPKSSSPDGVRRGSIYVMVTHRPWNEVFDEVSFNSGYPFKADSVPTLRIGSKRTEMFAEGEGAWFETPGQDRSNVEAMVRGRDMSIRGESQRGTKTTDIFSLTGFTAAYNAASKACGAPPR